MKRKLSSDDSHKDDKNALFMGFDLSTQGLKVAVINRETQLILAASVNFEKDLPSYKTHGGVVENEHKGDKLIARVPSMMFVAAVDMLLDKMKDKLDFKKVVAVSASGQQHGTIWWKTHARDTLKRLNAEGGDLVQQLKAGDCFALQNAPMWKDSSTETECREIEDFAGGAQKVATVTGSRCFERFSGPQIAKVIRHETSAYNNTERISLISALIPSLFLGDYSPVDSSDASGMNLQDLQTMDWSDHMVRATVCAASPTELSEEDEERKAHTLRGKLGQIAVSHSVIGYVHNYFVQKYGFASDCQVVAGSGDNGCSLAGLQISHAGDIAVSLGTSDTLFFVMSDAKPSGKEGHVMLNPVDPLTYFAMLCYKNGSQTREYVRDLSATTKASWPNFNKVLESTKAGNDGNIGFYFHEPEIIPTVNARGIFRFDSSGKSVNSFDHKYDVRGCVEGQFLSMRLHADTLGLAKPKRIIATGGGSINHSLLQILASVFDTPVYTSRAGPDTAALGAAFRAIHAHLCKQAQRAHKKLVPFTEAFSMRSGESLLELVAEPRSDEVAVYEKMRERYAALEKEVVARVEKNTPATAIESPSPSKRFRPSSTEAIRV